jgi:hypothetical protein
MSLQVILTVYITAESSLNSGATGKLKTPSPCGTRSVSAYHAKTRVYTAHDHALARASCPATCAFVESVVDHKSAKGRVLAVHRPYGRRRFRRDFPGGANPRIGPLAQGTGSALMINYL